MISLSLNFHSDLQEEKESEKQYFVWQIMLIKILLRFKIQLKMNEHNLSGLVGFWSYFSIEQTDKNSDNIFCNWTLNTIYSKYMRVSCFIDKDEKCKYLINEQHLMFFTSTGKIKKVF